MRTIMLLGLLLLGIGLATNINAQTEPISSLNKIVVTASRLPPTSVGAPGGNTVITREEIDLLQPGNTVELLRHVTGLHIDLPGGLGGVSSIYMRGADPNYTQILIDGVQVNDPTNSRGGSFDVSSIDISSIDRVEITRGSGSALRGADAIAGTVNFITRNGGTTSESDVTISVGSFGQRRANIGLRGPLSNHADLSASASVVKEGATVLGNKFANQVVAAKSQFFLPNGGTLRLTGRSSNSESSSFPDDSGGPQYAVYRLTDQRKAVENSAGAMLEQAINDRWHLRFESTFFESDEDFESPGVAPGLRNPFGIPRNNSVNRFQRFDMRASTYLAANKTTELISGLETRVEKGESNSRLFFKNGSMESRFDLRRQTNSGFMEGRWYPIPQLLFEGGGRITDSVELAAQTSFSLGAIYKYRPWDTRFKTNWAEGFKLPSFFALGNAIVGNSTLKPETSRSYEASIEQPVLSGNGKTTLTFFQNYFHNNIDYDDELNLMVNRSLVLSQGGELGFDWVVHEKLSLKSQLTYVDTDIRDDPEELRNRPNWRATAIVNWWWQRRLSISMASTYVGTVLDSSIPTGDFFLDKYIRFDIALGWHPTPRWDVNLAIDNFFDSNYQEVLGFKAPGFAPRLAVRFFF